MAKVKSEGGFVKLSRKLTEWGWYDDPNVLAVWIHILMMVNWKEGEYRGMKVKPGQKITSIHKIAKEVGLSYPTTRRILGKLESTHEIEIKRHTFGSLLTVMKWEEYQVLENKGEPKMNHERTKDEPQVNHQYRRKKEVKKVRREEESPLTQSFPSPRRSKKGEKSKEEMIQIAEDILKARGRL